MPFFKKKAPAYDHEKATLARNLDEAEIRHLEVLRREIANMIIQISPDLMIVCYDKAARFEREITENPPRAAAEEAALVAKFPMFSDFDLIGTRHFVPYSASHLFSDDDLIERYHDITRMLIFMKNRSDGKSIRQAPLHNEDERQVLDRCMKTEKDRLFKQRIGAAIDRFYAYRTGLEKGDPTTSGIANFEDAEIAVIHLPSYGAIEYGISFKKTDEFAVYSFFVHDDGRISHMYDRSDASFKDRYSLAFAG